MITALMLIGAMNAHPRALYFHEVMGNPDCKIKTAHGLALLHWPSASGIRFAVLDDAGVVFDGRVPFVPHQQSRISLIKRSDGKVLVAFANFTRRSSRIYGAFQTGVPVRVYFDGEIIHQTDEARQFGVASDGSSFFTIEPSLDAALGLQIHGVDSATVQHIDLVKLFTSHEISVPPDFIDNAAGYSHAQDEVMVMPSGGADLEGDYEYYPNPGHDATYLFYSLRHGRWRTLKGEGNRAFFRSSREAYFVHRCKGSGVSGGFIIPGSETVIIKKEFLWDGDGKPEAIEAWTHSIDLDGFRGSRTSFLGNGSLLQVSAANTHVLDATTGEVVFAFPTTENLSRAAGLTPYIWTYNYFMGDTAMFEVRRDRPVGRAYHERALARLKNVMPLDATTDDVAVLSDLRVEDGEFVLNQYLYQREPPDNRSFDYVFDPKGLHVDAKPQFRRENPPGDMETCSIDANSRVGLQEADGKLIYRSTGRSGRAD